MPNLVIKKDDLEKNIETVLQVCQPARVIGVVKGNGYGLGLIEFATLLKEKGVDFFAVAELSEALTLRQEAFTEEILVLTPVNTKNEVNQIIENNLTATISSYENAVLYNGAAQEMETKVKAHIKIDTGFGRFGFSPTDTENVVSIGKFLDCIQIEGAYSHLYASFGSEKLVKKQYDDFMAATEAIAGGGIELNLIHIANSCAALRFDYTRMSAVRIGSAFLGRLPIRNKWGLKRIAYLEDEVVDIKWLGKGHNIGYGGVFKTKKPTKIAVVKTGYIHGFCCEKSRDMYRFSDVLRYCAGNVKGFFGGKKFYGTVHGKKARVLGHVSMCNLCLDITNIDAKIGDSVTFDINPLFVDSAILRVYD